MKWTPGAARHNSDEERILRDAQKTIEKVVEAAQISLEDELAIQQMEYDEMYGVSSPQFAMYQTVVSTFFQEQKVLASMKLKRTSVDTSHHFDPERHAYLMDMIEERVNQSNNQKPPSIPSAAPDTWYNGPVSAQSISLQSSASTSANISITHTGPAPSKAAASKVPPARLQSRYKDQSETWPIERPKKDAQVATTPGQNQGTALQSGATDQANQWFVNHSSSQPVSGADFAGQPVGWSSQENQPQQQTEEIWTMSPLGWLKEELPALEAPDSVIPAPVQSTFQRSDSAPQLVPHHLPPKSESISAEPQQVEADTNPWGPSEKRNIKLTGLIPERAKPPGRRTSESKSAGERSPLQAQSASTPFGESSTGQLWTPGSQAGAPVANSLREGYAGVVQTNAAPPAIPPINQSYPYQDQNTHQAKAAPSSGLDLGGQLHLDELESDLDITFNSRSSAPSESAISSVLKQMNPAANDTTASGEWAPANKTPPDQSTNAQSARTTRHASMADTQPLYKPPQISNAATNAPLPPPVPVPPFNNKQKEEERDGKFDPSHAWD